MDFYEIKNKKLKSNNRSTDSVIYPDFLYVDTKDIVCKGGTMYAFWNNGMWDTSMMNLVKLIDNDIFEYKKKLLEKNPEGVYEVKTMRSNSSGMRNAFESYTNLMPQSDIQFNTKIIFSNEAPKREDYSTSILNYTPTKGSTENFDTLMDRLYSQKEKLKIQWFMGALLTNRMANIQKFMFLYGGKGTGKGTVLKIFKKLFEGYYKPINLRELSSNSAFATSQVQEVPLLIDDDCNLSEIYDDTSLLKLTAHEPINVNRKYQTPYDVIFTGLLITASNQRYKVRNVDSGITRRAIVVEPTSYTFDSETYFDLMKKIDYEIPAIAQEAIDIFNKLGPHYYDNEIDRGMIEASDYIFEFVSLYYEQLGDEVTLSRAAALYKEYLDDLGFESRGYKRKIKTELQRYYRNFSNQKKIDGVNVKNVFSGLKKELFIDDNGHKEHLDTNWIDLNNSDISILKEESGECQAQYTNADGYPLTMWKLVKTYLKDIDETKLHYVNLPENHIVIDFDLKNSLGEKSLELNLKEANKFPKTYAEVSKSGGGLHLHYIFDGDASKLSRVYDEGIEIKVFTGNGSLRRKLTKCNNLEVAHISTGLPLKEENKKMFEQTKDFVWTEKSMKTAVKRNLLKEYHANTAPSMNFIFKIFEDAKNQGLKYDLTDYKKDILVFAHKSTNQKEQCLKLAHKITYSTIDDEDIKEVQKKSYSIVNDEELYFFDVEVFPNLMLIVLKQFGKEPKSYFNPTPTEIEEIMSHPLIGFNNRSYDNLIVYAGYLGKTNYEIYELSKAIIDGKANSLYPMAREISYSDIYDYSSKKQSLKKWEIDMGITYDEFEYDFNEPLPEELWERCCEYCTHDVIATEKLFSYIRYDYTARQILSELSGLSMNATNNQHTAAILFGDDPRPQDKFVYTDLSKEFPGYIFREFGIPDDQYTEVPVSKKSIFMGKDPSEGGRVYSNPGIYFDVALLDIASLHPSTICNINYFGPYTKAYSDLKQARVYIKHNNFEAAGELFDGKLKPYLTDHESAKQLAYALKIVLNTVYGMTSAKFENKFKHPKNADNIIAKRGALFMIKLQDEVEKRGYRVAHIKTDSIKIPNATQEIIDFVMEFGKKYGYDFELEHTYKRMALINKAVYIAQLEDGSWEATGAQFAEPYVYKTLFTGEDISKEDFFLTKQVKGRIYLGDEFVGRLARVYCSKTGTDMWRVGDTNRGAVTGTKGYKWKLASEFKDISDVDMSYYHELVKDAIKNINKVGPSADIITQHGWFDDLITTF